MQRGKGLPIQQYYKWGKQPNGRYTIFDVPVFAPFSRESGEGKKKVTITVNEQDIQNAIEKLKQGSYYPPVHEKHQDLSSNEERENYGYLDNVYMKNGWMYADLCEFEKETIDKIKRLKLPYRSLEYEVYHDQGMGNEIISLAMLTSKPPHFKEFPILALEDQPITEGNRNYIEMFSSKERILQFEQRRKILNFSKQEEEKLKIFGKKDIKEDPTSIQACGGDPAEETPAQKPTQQMMEDTEGGDNDMSGDINEKILAHLDRNEAVLNKLVELLGEEDEEDTEQMSEDFEDEEYMEEDEDEGISSENPSSVAMSASNAHTAQFNRQVKNLNNMVLQLTKEMQNIKGERTVNQFNQELKAMCEENPAINYEAEKKYLLQFSDEKSKKAHLDYVKMNSMQQFTSNVPGRTINGLMGRSMDSSYMEQFSSKPHVIQSVAKQARQDYRDTVGQLNVAAAKQFQREWKTEENFVKTQVELAEIREGV